MSLRAVPHELLPPEGHVHGRSSLRTADAQPEAAWKLIAMGEHGSVWPNNQGWSFEEFDPRGFPFSWSIVSWCLLFSCFATCFLAKHLISSPFSLKDRKGHRWTPCPKAGWRPEDRLSEKFPWVGNNSGKKNTLITSWKSNMELPPKKKTMLKGNFIFQSNHQFFSDMLVFMGYILQNQHFEPQTWRRMEDYFLLQFGDFQVNHVIFQGRTLPDTNRKNTWNLGLGLFQERILLVLGRVA